MSKTILAEVNGFTPIMDCIVNEVGLIEAAVFGRVWRYCQMEDGVCKASVETIAKNINLSGRTVRRHLKKLCEAGYLVDLTPDNDDSPHIYADTGKVQLKAAITAEISEGDMTESQEGMTESQGGYDRKSHKDSSKDRSLSVADATDKGATPQSPSPAFKKQTSTLTEGQSYFLEVWKRKRFATDVQKRAIADCEREVGTERLKNAIDWAARNGISRVDSILTAARGGKAKKVKAKPSANDHGIADPSDPDIAEWLAKRKEQSG